jgi:uroporphyrin-III C-methyltransferase
MNNFAQPGTVYLVGAGPGDPDLITVRGQKLLRRADVVIYDRLVHPDLLEHCQSSAWMIYVGKKPGEHTCTQAEINALLTTTAARGNVVVRLKGGDPFVYGRGGEEAITLREAGVPFEVVPGITSAISAPGYAGIPVTHRGVSNAFTVMTGHTCSREDSALDWPALAEAGTLVILMGLGRLPRIAGKLIDHGRNRSTPVAVIRSACTRDQEVVYGTLETIGERTRHLEPPATVLVGAVARLGQRLSWYDPAGETEYDFPGPGPGTDEDPLHPLRLPQREPVYAYAASA